MQSISINGKPLDLARPNQSENIDTSCSRNGICTKQPSPCENFSCVDRWNTVLCTCGGTTLSPNCLTAIQPVSLSDGGFLEFKISNKHRRMQLLPAIYTNHQAWNHHVTKRSVDNTSLHLDFKENHLKSLSITFKTVKSNGLLYFSSTNKFYTSIELRDGKLVYSSYQGNTVSHTSPKHESYSDGNWHTLRLMIKNQLFSLTVDKTSIVKELDINDVHDFLDPYLTEIFIGNIAPEHVPELLNPVNFEGCLVNFTINNEVQPFDGAGNIFNSAIQHGKVFRGCFDLAKLGGAQVTDPLSIGLSLVIGFIIILLIATAVSFIFFKFHKHQKEKVGAPPPIHSKSVMPGTLLGSGNHVDLARGLHVPDHGELLRGGHHYVGPEIISKKYKDREVANIDSQRSQRPDIIEREVVKTSSLQRDEHHPPPLPHDHGPNLELEEFGEHYDLDNSSTIAPFHYKGYRDSGMRKFKASPLSMPGYTHHKHSQQQHRHSPHHAAPFVSRVPPPQSNQNSSSSTPRPHQTTPLARLSPSSELSSQHPRILTLHDISGKPLQSALLATTSSSGGVGKDVLHSNSERSLNSPVMSQLSAQSSSVSRKNPIPHPKTSNVEPMGLTAEDFERLNTRPRTSSLVSTLDAVSTSSDPRVVGSHLPHMHHSQNVDAISSTSSDESGNDSFTCSEIEYDNASMNGDSISKYGKSDSMGASQGDAAESNKPESTYDGFDSSFRGSLSTLVASDDELSSHIGNIYRAPGAVAAQAQQMGWDYLLNWGPNFESLVGVFKDIAKLPDTANGVPNTLRIPNNLQKPSEEYV